MILALLFRYACLKLVEVGHDVRIDHLDVLVVLSRQMVFHKAYLLSEHLDFFFVLP